MSYIRVVEGQPVPFSVTPDTLYREVSPVCWPWPVPDGLLAEYDIYPVRDAVVPQAAAGYRLVEDGVRKVGAHWMRKWREEEIPRAEHPRITLLQFHLALIELNLDDEVANAIDKLEPKLRKQLRALMKHSPMVSKDGPLVLKLQSVLKLTEEQIDAIWAAA